MLDLEIKSYRIEGDWVLGGNFKIYPMLSKNSDSPHTFDSEYEAFQYILDWHYGRLEEKLKKFTRPSKLARALAMVFPSIRLRVRLLDSKLEALRNTPEPKIEVQELPEIQIPELLPFGSKIYRQYIHSLDQERPITEGIIIGSEWAHYTSYYTNPKAYYILASADKRFPTRLLVSAVDNPEGLQGNMYHSSKEEAKAWRHAAVSKLIERLERF